jgi:hypothetical protein
MMRAMRGRGFTVTILLALLAACASTSIVEEWQSPDYKGGPFKRLLVVGVTKEATVRRIFEDEFVRQLRARGTDAVASYTLIPEDGQVDRPRLERAVQESGADGVVITRVLKVEQRTQVVPGTPAFPAFGTDIYRHYGTGWGGVWTGYASPPAVFQYEEVRAETKLFGARNAALVWAAQSEVFAPTDARKDSADFAARIIAALASRKLI